MPPVKQGIMVLETFGVPIFYTFTIQKNLFVLRNLTRCIFPKTTKGQCFLSMIEVCGKGGGKIIYGLAKLQTRKPAFYGTAWTSVSGVLAYFDFHYNPFHHLPELIYVSSAFAKGNVQKKQKKN